MSDWYRLVERETVHDGFVQVHRDTVRSPGGEDLVREVVTTDDAVAVVPLLDDGTVVLLRQYRHPVGSYLLEIPAGKLDVDGEAPEDAARRELAEEIAMQARELVTLTTFVNSGGSSSERTTVYLGRGMTETSRPDDFTASGEEAEMEIVRLPLDDAVAAVHDGTITDAKTVIGLLLVAARD